MAPSRVRTPAALIATALATTLIWGVPPNPTRTTPPPGIESAAVALGAEAPKFTLSDSSGVAFSLADALAKGPTVVVFYRGFW